MLALKTNFYRQAPIANAFFILQELVFPGLDLAFALEQCHLDEVSMPYGLFAGETATSASSVQAVSILNATPMTVLFGENQYQAVQLGTVTTHPDWRGQGLSAQLLHQVLSDYQDQADFFFLFANKEVLTFYPRFGFSAVTEHHFERPFSARTHNLRQLNLSNPEDKRCLRQHLTQAVPISKQFGVMDYGVLREFALNKFMPQAIWQDKAADLLLVATVEAARLIIHDLISKHLPENYLETLRWPAMHTLETRFTPDLFKGHFQPVPYQNDDDQLFVLINKGNPELSLALSAPFQVPALAKT